MWKAKLAEELSKANMKIQQLEQVVSSKYLLIQKESLENWKLAKDLDDVKDQLEEVKQVCIKIIEQNYFVVLQEKFIGNKKRDDSDR